jgi:hypothetical protein
MCEYNETMEETRAWGYKEALRVINAMDEDKDANNYITIDTFDESYDIYTLYWEPRDSWGMIEDGNVAIPDLRYHSADIVDINKDWYCNSKSLCFLTMHTGKAFDVRVLKKFQFFADLTNGIETITIHLEKSISRGEALRYYKSKSPSDTFMYDFKSYIENFILSRPKSFKEFKAVNIGGTCDLQAGNRKIVGYLFSIPEDLKPGCNAKLVATIQDSDEITEMMEYNMEMSESDILKYKLTGSNPELLKNKAMQNLINRLKEV